MRILISVDPEIPVPPKFYGGIERIVFLLVKELRSRGHIVGLITNRDSTVLADRIFFWRGRHSQHAPDTVRNTFTLWKAACDFRPQLIHSFSRMVYLLPSLPFRIPIIMSYQRHPTFLSVYLSAKIFGSTLTFTGVSEYITELGRKAGGRWYTIHNCVDTGQYIFRATVTKDAPLVFLSRIERIKGVHTAIQIARLTGKRLIIAGNHSNTEEDARYWKEEILPCLGTGTIEYVGEVNDEQKNNLLGQAAALVVPIEWDEPFGIVFIEALACGTPVISSPRGALPEIVRHGIEGYLIKDVEEGCRAVRALPRIDRRRCRQRVEESFSVESIVTRYEKLYLHLHEGRPPAEVILEK